MWQQIIPRKSTKLFIVIILIILLSYICYYIRTLTTITTTSTTTFNAISSIEDTNRNFNDFLNRKQSMQTNKFTGERIVHLDLKGAPPKIDYYHKLFPLLTKLGATGVLIEYEDMFPYDGDLTANTSALNSYNLDDIKLINKLAIDNNLEIIPLVQTFGHLEFLLKLEQFKDYREIDQYPQVVCPTHPNTRRLLTEMLQQIIENHPKSKRIHIGADEVYHIGICERCKNTMIKYNLSKNMLFLEHIKTITDWINKNHPHIEILMWDDEFRSFTLKELKHQLNPAVTPVVWRYTKDVYDELGPSLWDLYEQVFNKVWIASAYKGATGSNQYICDVTHYVQNHRSWLYIFNEYSNRLKFDGIILTGWQRYDHFAILCELLPVSYPSLAMCLRVILGYNDSPLSPPTDVAKLLNCKQPYGLIGTVFGNPKCLYPGSDIFELIIHLQQLKQDFDVIINDSRIHGWLNHYNIINKFSNPDLIQSVTSSLQRIRMELKQIDDDLINAMNEMYDNYTIYEWKQQYIEPFQKQIDQLSAARDRVLSQTVWPRRPLPPQSSPHDDF